MTYTRQCAWCKKILGAKVVPNDTDASPKVTHTICPACSASVLEEVNQIQLERTEVLSERAR